MINLDRSVNSSPVAVKPVDLKNCVRIGHSLVWQHNSLHRPLKGFFMVGVSLRELKKTPAIKAFCSSDKGMV